MEEGCHFLDTVPFTTPFPRPPAGSPPPPLPRSQPEYLEVYLLRGEIMNSTLATLISQLWLKCLLKLVYLPMCLFGIIMGALTTSK